MKTLYLSALADITNNKNKSMKIKDSVFWKVASLMLLSLSFSVPSYAHRGPAEEVDNCRIKVGFEKIHFTAYTPKITRGKGYCQFIPNVGLTNLVFDYEGKKLRDVSIEFEVTKEPEGTRVFYQQPQKNKNGTMNATVDFTKFGAGDYLAHVTIVHKGDKLDTHLPFYVGAAETNIPWGLISVLIVVVLLVIFFIKLNRTNKINKQSSV